MFFNIELYIHRFCKDVEKYQPSLTYQAFGLYKHRSRKWKQYNLVCNYLLMLLQWQLSGLVVKAFQVSQNELAWRAIGLQSVPGPETDPCFSLSLYMQYICTSKGFKVSKQNVISVNNLTF